MQADETAEERRERRANRAIARLAAKELAKYSAMSEADAWALFQRVRALKGSGSTDAEILRRLNP